MLKTIRFGLAVALLAVLGLAPLAGAHDFAEGYYLASGTVRPQGMSFYMQGSHVLASTSGSQICLLRSTAYDLSMYEGDKVQVKGWTQHTVEGHSQIMNVTTLTVLTSSRHTITHKLLASGSFSSWVAPAAGANYVIRDAEAWTRLYLLHDPASTTAAPAVDFSKHMVFALFMGAQSSTAHSIEINKVQRSGDRTFVTSTRHAPPAGSMIATVMTNPFVFVRVTKAGGQVWFNSKKANELVLDATLKLSGHVTLGAGVNASKVKVGVFSMNDAARYFQWPGNVPGDVTAVGAGGQFNKVLTAPLPGSTHERYYVIAFEDLGGDNRTNGDRLVVSAGFTFSDGKWRREGSSATHASGGTASLSLTLTAAPAGGGSGTGN
ncbi:MAG: protease complex subunit PrcB family protein [Planctomycetes bacterium]|nr:protease complex subunit PrcB family protein [Planctomycetota bacterium]